jgi:hypothetical protein
MGGCPRNPGWIRGESRKGDNLIPIAALRLAMPVSVPFLPDAHAVATASLGLPSPTLAGLISRYVLENPWPLAILLGLIGAGLAWKWLREGERAYRDVAAGCLVAGGVILGLGLAITTSAERAKVVVRAFVTHAESGDIPSMLALLAERCTLHYGAPENPGLPREMWEPSIGLLRGRYAIDSNRITRLDAESDGGDAATVELACVTTVDLAPYPTPNAWWLRVAMQPDGAWRIERIAARRIGNSTPEPGAF